MILFSSDQSKGALRSLTAIPALVDIYYAQIVFDSTINWNIIHRGTPSLRSIPPFKMKKNCYLYDLKGGLSNSGDSILLHTGHSHWDYDQAVQMIKF